MLWRVSVNTRQARALWPYTLWRFMLSVPLAHTPMSHQRVQLPPERNLISICNQVPEVVRAFHEVINVSLCAESYTREVSVPLVLPRASRAAPFLNVIPLSVPAARAI